MKNVLMVVATLVSAIMLVVFALTGCGKKTVDIPMVGEVEFPKGYEKTVTHFPTEEVSETVEYTYKSGDELIEEDWSKFEYWSTGPEDGMTYTITEDDDTYQDYVLIITNPNDEDKLVAIGVQTPDGNYTTYQFFY